MISAPYTPGPWAIYGRDNKPQTAPWNGFSIKDVNGQSIVACNMVASKESSRFYLKGVYTHVKENRRYYVATDGHKMIRINEALLEGDNGEALIIPSDFILNVVRLGKIQDSAQLTMTRDGDKVPDATLSLTGTILNFQPIDGNYPDYERAMAFTQGTTESIGLNPDYLVTIKKAYNYYRGVVKRRQSVGLNLMFKDASSPIRISLDANDNFDAVLMPLRA